MTGAVLTRTQRIRAFASITVGISIVGIQIGLIIPLLTLVLEAQGVPSDLIGYSAAFGTISIALCAPFVPAATRRFGVIRLMLCCYALGVATVLLLKLFDNVWAWFPLRFLFNASMVGLFVSTEAWIGAIALTLVALQTVWLRLSGWTLVEVSGFAIFFAAVTLAGVCAAIRAMWLFGGRCRSLPSVEYAIAIAPLVCSVVLAAALTNGQMSVFVVFLLWFVVAAEEAITLLFFVPQLLTNDAARQLISAREELRQAHSVASPAPERRFDQPTAASSPLRSSPPPAMDAEDKLWRFDEAEGPAPHFVAGNVSQQLTRAREATTEVVYGYLRADFAVGERHQTLHVAFCPPLAAAPEMEICQVEGPEVSVKTTLVEAHGARVELRRSGGLAEAVSVVLELHAAAENGEF